MFTRICGKSAAARFLGLSIVCYSDGVELLRRKHRIGLVEGPRSAPLGLERFATHHGHCGRQCAQRTAQPSGPIVSRAIPAADRACDLGRLAPALFFSATGSVVEPMLMAIVLVLPINVALFFCLRATADGVRCRRIGPVFATRCS